jgi:hypothetical protein
MNELLPTLPYPFIGQVVVTLVGIAVVVGVVFGTLYVGGFVWRRTFAAISDLMYRQYKTYPAEERPPVWMMRISGVSLAISRFEFTKIGEAYRRAEILTENDATLRQYLSQTFLDDH